MKQPKYRYFEAIHNGEKVPRKEKKYFLGRKISTCKLKRQLKGLTVQLYKNENRASYPIIVFNPIAFCPDCGCTSHRGVYRPGYYPEVWNSYYCLRCGKLVAWEDNSPFTHVLEEFMYEEIDKQASKPELLPTY